MFSTMMVSSFASGALITTQGWTWLNLGSLVPLGVVALGMTVGAIALAAALLLAPVLALGQGLRFVSDSGFGSAIDGYLSASTNETEKEQRIQVLRDMLTAWPLFKTLFFIP